MEKEEMKHPYGNIDGIATLTGDTLVRRNSAVRNKDTDKDKEKGRR